MKYVDEYRDPVLATRLVERIHKTITRPWTLMEVCGGQTHTILKSGIDQLLPSELRIIHGPGCPVCVTPLEQIDRGLAIATRPDVIFTTFGDMLRVPGSMTDLLQARSQGADVRMVYSPLQAVQLAVDNPNKRVVFFAVGFETTAPATALAVREAKRLGLNNFFLLVAHVLVLPAMEFILASPHCQVQAFLAAGHACTVTGYQDYPAVASRYHVPMVVTGFEPADLLEGILLAVEQLEKGQCEVINQYGRSVRPEGNPQARAVIEEVYEICDRAWRGLGILPGSGLRLNSNHQQFDAELEFAVSELRTREPLECLSGQVLQGILRPDQCPAFGVLCTPAKPLGAPMVSSEGACSAYYKFRSQGTGLAVSGSSQ